MCHVPVRRHQPVHPKFVLGGGRGFGMGKCPGAGASLSCLCHAVAAVSRHMFFGLDWMYVHTVSCTLNPSINEPKMFG